MCCKPRGEHACCRAMEHLSLQQYEYNKGRCGGHLTLAEEASQAKVAVEKQPSQRQKELKKKVLVAIRAGAAVIHSRLTLMQMDSGCAQVTTNTAWSTIQQPLESISAMGSKS